MKLNFLTLLVKAVSSIGAPGKVFYGCADYIDSKRPAAFILENVKGLLSHDGGATFQEVMRSLQSIGDGAYGPGLKQK